VVRKYSQTQLKTVQILRYTFSKMDRLLNGLLQDDIRAPRVDGSFARRLTFQPTKCCALHESPLRRAATQHPQVDVNGSNGPFVSFDTKGRKSQMLRHAHFYIKGGKQTFAAGAN
jgi:hypothetical protein